MFLRTKSSFLVRFCVINKCRLSSVAKSFQLDVGRNCQLTLISRADGPRSLKIGLPKLNREPSFDFVHLTANQNVLVEGSKDAYTIIQLPTDPTVSTGVISTELEVPPDCNLLIKDESHNGELQVDIAQLENAQIKVINPRGSTKVSKIKSGKLTVLSQTITFSGNCTVEKCDLLNESITLIAKMLHVGDFSLSCDVLDARIDAIYSRTAKFLFENGSLLSKYSHGDFDVEKSGCESGKISLGCLNGNANVRVPHSSCELHAFVYKFERFLAEVLDGQVHIDVGHEDLDEQFDLISPPQSSATETTADRVDLELVGPQIEVSSAIRAAAFKSALVNERLTGSLISNQAKNTNAKRSVKAVLSTGLIRLGVSSWPEWLLRSGRLSEPAENRQS